MDIEAALKEMITAIDTALAAEREGLAAAQRDAIDRMAEMLSKRARLSAMLLEASTVAVPQVQENPPAASTGEEPAVAEEVKPKTSDFILDLLSKAGLGGLSGPEIQAAGAAAGYTKGAIDKARTRLKEIETIYMSAGRWFAQDLKNGVKAA